MTAVASAPSLQPLRRLGSGWNSQGNNGQVGLDSMNTADEVSRIFTARKGPQRNNSSSTLNTAVAAASSTSDTDFNNTDIRSLRDPLNSVPADREAWTGPRNARALWPASKAEATVATSTGRTPAVPPSSIPLTPPISALQQAARVLPSQKIMQTAQQISEGRLVPLGQASSDPPALLVLLPMNGTFERKNINVPMFPEILRIGRQTNAKTVPTATNGYFDSKVLSRQHAEVWGDRNGKIWIRDVKSSNGTFVNGVRLSPESRDSEPHELRENDLLELGIDIVSEDQKSIVHHKVSAKVEHAGISNNTASVLDLNIGDIDPGSGGGLMGSILPPQQMRGRGLSQGSMSSNGRMNVSGIPANMSGFGVQRHMNAWLSPVSIEQVVKRLGNELRQAKQQANDLHRTNDFFDALLESGPGKEVPKPPASILPTPGQTNGVASSEQNDPMSPYSQPPAPPPQHPLPEKPDVARLMLGDSSQPIEIKDVETEKADLFMGPLPTQVDIASSQILTLAEALASTRKELETQGSRVSYLEELLCQERRAREKAEQRAKHLLDRARLSSDMKNGDHRELQTLSDDSEGPQTEPNDSSDTRSLASNLSEDTITNPNPSPMEELRSIAKDSDTTRSLRGRLSLVLQEMDEMKTQMESYKRRAESAEFSRDSLAGMVERIRKSPPSSPSTNSKNNLHKEHGSHAVPYPPASLFANGSANGSYVPPAFSESGDKRVAPDTAPDATNGAPAESHRQMEILQGAMATAFSTHRDDRMLHAAPYASILGVVLLGVGIMAYLNSWQKAEH